jgi:hypothetical protein
MGIGQPARRTGGHRRGRRRGRPGAVLQPADHHAELPAGVHLQAQEGRLFAPLAYTKTYAMAAAAGLAVTLVPVLMGYLIRGRIPNETKNPLNRC